MLTSHDFLTSGRRDATRRDSRSAVFWENAYAARRLGMASVVVLVVNCNGAAIGARNERHAMQMIAEPLGRRRTETSAR